jgi:hypothetical protein
MNNFGKALVLVNLVLSLMLLAWALLLLIRPVDYAWKEPRKMWGPGAEGKKEPNELIASQIDERVAGYEKLREARKAAFKWAQQAEKKLAQVSGGFGYNHLTYLLEAERLWDAPGSIPIKEIRYNKDGTLAVRNVPGRWWELPVWDQPVPGVDKSYTKYLLDLWKKAKEIEAVNKTIAKLHDQQKQVTLRLNGERGKDGKIVEPGYYDLLEAEADASRKLKEELEYLQPLWVMELYNASLLRDRRKGLEKRIVELGGDPSQIQLK